MRSLELSILLHRALEARVDYLAGLLAQPGWQEDPEQLHQVRVGSRRVRSVLDLVQPELYPGFKRHGRKLKRLTRALGSSRELDVHAMHLQDLAARVPGLATGAALDHALEVLETLRAGARKKMARDLAGKPFKNLSGLLAVPSLSDPFQAGNLAEDVWDALAPLLEGAFAPLPGLLDKEDASSLHGVRIQVKRLRYSLEVLGAAFPQAPEARLRQLKDLQTALGEHHDLVMLEALLQGIYGGLKERNRKVLASGTLEVLAYVGEARLNAFDRFRGVARGLALREFRASVRLDLGLPEGAAL